MTRPSPAPGRVPPLRRRRRGPGERDQVDRLPRWVRSADVLTLALVVLAASAALAGGFRLRAGEWRVSFTSPERLLLWAAIVVAVRHWQAPRPTLPERLIHGIRVAGRSEALRAVWGIALASRVAVALLGLLAVFAVGYSSGEKPPFRVSTNELVNLPARWDAGWYLTVAQAGYRWDPHYREQQNIAFFPAYPLLIRYAGRLLGGGTPQVVLAGVLISNAAFLWGLVYLFRLARDHPEIASADRARAATLLLASYPFAVFYGQLYTESLFLAASAGAFWHMNRHRFRAAAAWGLVAGLTRPNGMLLVLPLAILAIADIRQGEPASGRLRRMVAPLAAAVMPVVGMLVFSAFMYDYTGNAFQWAAMHERWGRTSHALWDSVVGPFEYVATAGVLEYLRTEAANLLNLLATFFAAVLVWPVTRRLGIAYGALLAVNLVVPLAMGGTLSMARLTATMFPLFLWLAAAIPQRRLATWVLIFALGQGYMAVMFHTWRPPY